MKAAVFGSGQWFASTILKYHCVAGLQSSEWKRHDPWCKVVFPNGDSYFGGYVQGKKSGLGWYIFSNGGSYAGNYLEGKRQGDGLIMMPDSACYMGQFAEDKFHGQVKLILSCLSPHQIQSIGIEALTAVSCMLWYRAVHGTTLNQWLHAVWYEQGAYFYPDGSCYVGGWESGLKEGKAVYWDKDGGCLQGNWSKGVLTGKATFDQLAHSFQVRSDSLTESYLYLESIPQFQTVFWLKGTLEIIALGQHFLEKAVKNHVPEVLTVYTLFRECSRKLIDLCRVTEHAIVVLEEIGF